MMTNCSFLLPKIVDIRTFCYTIITGPVVETFWENLIRQVLFKIYFTNNLLVTIIAMSFNLFKTALHINS